MDTTEVIKPPPPRPSVGHQRSAAPPPPPFHFEPPPLEERLGEILPLIAVVPVAGPPVICFVGAWVLFALMLTGPFLLLVTFGLAAVILVAIPAAILAPPYLFARRVHTHWTRHHEPRTPGHRLRQRRFIGVSLRSPRPGPRLR